MDRVSPQHRSARQVLRGDDNALEERGGFGPSAANTPGAHDSKQQTLIFFAPPEDNGAPQSILSIPAQSFNFPLPFLHQFQLSSFIHIHPKFFPLWLSNWLGLGGRYRVPFSLAVALDDYRAGLAYVSNPCRLWIRISFHGGRCRKGFPLRRTVSMTASFDALSDSGTSGAHQETLFLGVLGLGGTGPPIRTSVCRTQRFTQA